MQSLRPAARLISRTSFARRRRCLATLNNDSGDHVRIVEVGPRDGLQNEKTSIPLATKMELVRRLAATGLDTIEAGSFVSPKWVPQMANSPEILQQITANAPPSTVPITYQWLLPNVKGLENLLKIYSGPGSAGGKASSASAYPTPPPSPTSTMAETSPALNTSSNDANAMPSHSSGTSAMNSSTSTSKSSPSHEISIFLAATETFSRKNTNCSIADSLTRMTPLIELARRHNLSVRAYISVALGCPFEGPHVDPARVASLATSLLSLGVTEISVADTTGMGTAPRTETLLRTLVAAGVKPADLAMHFHDTYGQALVNTMVALDAGVRVFDAAVAGLGGCPYSPGATGNVGTEDLVHCLNGLGMRTGVDVEAVAEVGEWISGELGRASESRAGKAIMARRRVEA